MWSFPKNSLEDAIKIAKTIEDKNGGNPMEIAMLVKGVGYKSPVDWRFRDLVRSANLYGLVSGATTVGAKVALDKIGEDIVAPSSPSQRQNALLNSFRHVDDFKKVEEYYRGKRIPEDEYFENTLIREFSIPRERVKTFITVFLANIKYLNLFNVKPISQTDDDQNEKGQPSSKGNFIETIEKATPNTKIREFLDTCFIMMPFGEWFDRYYKEIYIHSIKEAGFEPIRGDELFSTGSVVEQIWEQISKSTVLLADLSGRNANVFYELGLAHAARKPVILTAASIDDVPFDLRHLRVITYDIRVPNWAVLLGQHVTQFLKNAKTEPEKSIPQPFRDELVNEDNDEEQS